MKNKIIGAAVVFLYSTVLAFAALAETPIPDNPKKRIPQGKYVTAKEAYEKWSANPDGIKIIDCRTPEEYVFLGHPQMAMNIPGKLWIGEFDTKKGMPMLAENPDFIPTVKKYFKPSDSIFVLCRSGDRSAICAAWLDKEGFKNVHNIIDGFEGDLISDKDSYYNGKRMKNGWKNSGAPWTYDVDPNLAFFIHINREHAEKKHGKDNVLDVTAEVVA